MHRTIGIVGGVGPYAGLEVCKNVMDQTETFKDQDHLSLALLSFPGEISDRTAFILEETNVNPAYAIVEVIKKLVLIGSDVVGIACNTSHAPEIYNVITSELDRNGIKVKLVNMVEAVIKHILVRYPRVKKVGILSTKGCYTAKVYENALTEAGLEAIIPDTYIRNEVIHKAIYDSSFGIKAVSNPISVIATDLLREAVTNLRSKGADAVILGCTEISLAITCDETEKMILIDSSKVLANALLKESLPERVK